MSCSFLEIWPDVPLECDFPLPFQLLINGEMVKWWWSVRVPTFMRLAARNIVVIPAFELPTWVWGQGKMDAVWIWSVAKGEPCHPVTETDFGCLYQQSKTVAQCEDWDENQLVNLELCLMAQLCLHHDRKNIPIIAYISPVPLLSSCSILPSLVDKSTRYWISLLGSISLQSTVLGENS